MNQTPSTLKSEPVEGIVKMTAIERIANQNGLRLEALGWHRLLGLSATVPDVDTALRLAVHLDASLREIKPLAEGGSDVTCLFDGTELRIHARG